MVISVFSNSDLAIIQTCLTNTAVYILAILSKLKNREEFEGLEKRKGKGGKRRKKEE